VRLHALAQGFARSKSKAPGIDSLSFEERHRPAGRPRTDRARRQCALEAAVCGQARLKHNACLEDIDYAAHAAGQGD